MASWNELEHLRKNAAAFRALAKKLLTDPHCEDSEFADGFLDNVANWKRDEISLRQAEVLLELRDRAEIYTQYKGLSIGILLARCYAGRDELDDRDRARIEAACESNRGFLTGGQMGWFKRICKQLGEMEEYM